MNRSETTKFLSQLLISEKLNGIGKYWAREVSIDYGTADVRRVDFMQFVPPGQVCLSEIEKGIFICYEIKSCKADFKSGFGKNFIGEKNYFVMQMSTYKEVVQDVPYNIGVMVPIPIFSDKNEEFINPTKLTKERGDWKLSVVKPSIPQGRKKSMNELLFCMLRSGH